MWGRLARLEAVAQEDTMIVILPATGEEVRVPFDAPVRWMAAEWSRETGRDAEPDPVAERMADLVARGAHEKNPDRDGRVLGGGRRGA